MRSCTLYALILFWIGLAAMGEKSRVAACDETADEARPAIFEDVESGTSPAEPPPRLPTRKTIPAENLRMPDELQPCAANLEKIHSAVEKYKGDKGKLPDWLSDLVPDYLDKGDLLCPISKRARSRYWPDPKLPCSYTYEFSTAELSNNWGAVSGMVCQEWKERQVKLFGDVVPMIRCQHQPNVLSMSSGGQAFWGLGVWERVFMPNYRRGDELDPSERPFLYVVPAGGVDELVDFIGKVKAFRPKTPYQTLDHSRRAPAALKSAATRILATEKDQWSTAYQTALRVLLEDRIRTIADASPAQQRETVDLVKTFLTARRDRGLARADADLAVSAAKMLEDKGNLPLAVAAYQEFASLLSASEDRAVLDAAKQMEASAKKLQE